MTQLQVQYGALASSSNAAQAAADAARGHGSSAELATAGGAIPGAASVDYLDTLGTGWDDEISAWATATRDFGDRLAAAGEDYRAADDAAGGLFGGLGTILGGGR